MGMARDIALFNILQNQQKAQAEAKKKEQAALGTKVPFARNTSYSSGEYTELGAQGSDFFNQTKQRGTLFGN